MFLLNSSKLCKCFTNRRTIEYTSRYSSKKRLPTVAELKKENSKRLDVDHGYNVTPVDRSHLLKYVPKPEDLPPRSIKDSFLEGIIPLSTNETLQEKYITFLGRVRIGRLLEDMDIFAVHTGFKYLHAPTIPKDVASPFIFVTAHCDRINYTTYQRRHNQDIKLSGIVSWVGKSSMEVAVKLDQYWEGKWNEVTRAFFLMVARNATGQKSVSINPLKPLNDTEKKIFKGGEVRKLRRAETTSSHISQAVPTAEEQKIIHDLYKKVRKAKVEGKLEGYNPNFVPMDRHKLSNIIFSQPEDRNFYNTVFGGFIMRHAAELAWVLGYQFFRHRPSMRHISDITFHKPVAVNALLRMFARVVYTKDDYCQILVVVISSDPIKGVSERSNTFHFTLKAMKPVDHVYPKTYHEAMLYVDGMRHFNSNMESTKADNADDIVGKYMNELSQA